MKRAGPLYLLLWIVLSAVAALAAWYLNLAFLYLCSLWIDQPAWRPTGWSTGTLVTINRFSILVLGSIWLIFSTWLEIALRNSALEGKLWVLSRRIGLGIAATLVISFGILMLG